MFSLKKSAVATTLLTAVLLTPAATLAVVPDYSTNVASLVNYLEANQSADGSITGFGGETAWAVMGFAANGIDPNTVENSGVSVMDFLANNPPATVSGWERDLLAVTAAGENPFTFGGRNYVDQVQSFASANQIGSSSSINDDTFGILALISAGPSADQQIISDSVDFVIANQNIDGGWGFSVGGSSDPDSSAIAVQALQAADSAGFSNSGLSGATTDGVNYLTSTQDASGGWDNGFGVNAGSTAWSVLGILADDSAVENALNYIVSKQDSSGGIDGGFGVDTYTSANSLIAFGQTAFPVGSFDGTFEEPEDPDGEQTIPPTQNPPTDQNPPGQVLAANTSVQNGQVLAALPNTGITSNLIESPSVEQLSNQPVVNKVLLAALIIIEIGLLLRLLSGRIRKSVVN